MFFRLPISFKTLFHRFASQVLHVAGSVMAECFSNLWVYFFPPPSLTVAFIAKPFLCPRKCNTVFRYYPDPFPPPPSPPLWFRSYLVNVEAVFETCAPPLASSSNPKFPPHKGAVLLPDHSSPRKSIALIGFLCTLV